MNKSFLFTFVFVVVGAIVGAGFASGREILSFFAKYGFFSIIFIVLSGLLFFGAFYIFSKIGNMMKPKSISDITKAVFGKASLFVDFIFILSSFITLSSMLAGLDSTFNIAFSENYFFPLASIFSCIIVAIILNFGIKKIFSFTNKIIPFMFFVIILIALGFILFGQKQQIGYNYIENNIFSMSLSPILYVCMNTFSNIFLIAKTSSYLKRSKVATASMICSILLTISILLVAICILFGGENAFVSDMPMLSVAYSLGNLVGVLYFISLIIAIFTTICTTAYTISCWLNNYINNNFLCGVIVLIMGFVFSRFGFATIVDIFYPIEGVFGLILISFCFVYYYKRRKQIDNKYNATIVDRLEITKQNGKIKINKKYRKK